MCSSDLLYLQRHAPMLRIAIPYGLLSSRQLTTLAANEPTLYSRHVIENYGHIDCIFGRNAVTDVFPHILAHLEKTP